MNASDETPKVANTHLNSHDRLRLLGGPSPLEPMERLSRELGNVRIYVKRDDEGGRGGGGNKIRKFERQFADARNKGADTLLLAAHSQSNCARELIGCAAGLGFKTKILTKNLVDRQTEAYRNSGNALLMSILGAEFVSVSDDEGFPEALKRVAAQVASDGGSPYTLPLGASDPLGVEGYIDSGNEIIEETIRREGRAPDLIVTATGSCGTQAGLVLATVSSEVETKVLGFTVLHDAEVAAREVDALVSTTLGRPAGAKFRAWVDGRALGAGYGRPTPEGIDAIRRVARTEGLFLDPIYTGKAMAGLLDYLSDIDVGPPLIVVFVHTGGLPLLFAYQDCFEEA